jgi:hypothetical protein
MATQTFLWIVLPNGVSGSSLKFSVFVAPRLDPQRLGGVPGTLADFTFGNWARLMQGLSVTVQADSLSAPITATADASSTQPDPSLWTLMFPSTTTVKPFRFVDYSTGVEIVSYEVDVVDQTISNVYSNVIGCTPPRGKVSLAGISTAVMTGGSGGTGGTGGTANCDCFDLFFDPDDCTPAGGGSGGSGGGGTGSTNGASAPPDTAGCTPSPNALEQFITTISTLETTIVNFAGTPPISQGESATSILSRMGVTLTPTQLAFFNFQRFYNRYGLATPPSLQLDPVPGWSDHVLDGTLPWEFHEIVTMLGDFPVLLRKLGLVRDFTIPVSSLPAQTTGLTLSVSYTTPPSPPVTQNVTPKTMALINAASQIFRPADRAGSLVADGMLRLDNTSAFQVIQGQPDGAAGKMMDMGINELYRVAPTTPRLIRLNGVLQTVVGNQAGMETCTSIEPAAAPPALRSGVQVIQKGRAAAVASTFTRQAAFNSAMGGSVFYSDDLMRGYRVDVNDRGSWRSLCARKGTINLNGGTTTASVSLLDEGYVKAVSATKRNGYPFQLFVHESLWGWDSWSLCVPHPGNTVSDPSDADFALATNQVKPSTNTSALTSMLPFVITTDLHAQAGTLPRLRFGNTYQFRARVVDLAGNSLPLGGVTTSHPTPSWTYQRFEPVLSPALVPTNRFTLGESLETLVVRSDDPATTVTARFIAPPKAAQLEVETHGKLDALFAAGAPTGDFTLAYNLSAKESGTFLDSKVFQADSNAVVLSNDPTVAQVLVKDLPGKRGAQLPIAGGYMVYKGTSLPLPYLPDPLASGVAVYVNASGAPFTQAYGGASWDTAAPIRFELHAGTGTTTTVSAGTPGSTFTVTLPPATILEADYTSTVPTAQLGLLHHWQNGGQQSRTSTDAANGQVPFIAPNRRIRLVNAVKKPLSAASVTAATFNRVPSDTFATILGGGATLSSHSHSTGEVEMYVEWTETQDLLGAQPALGVPRRVFAHRLTVPYGSDTLSFPSAPTHNVADASCGLTNTAPNLRINFGDTKYRSVQFRCTASTRFTEYYPPSVLADPSVSTLTGNLSSSFTVYNSARAPRPDIAYVVPTFSWQTSATSHTRTGGNVRIYMNRPWFATGDGELLGVLVGNVASFVDVGDTVRPYVSEMGYDPLYADSFSALGIVDRANGLFTTLTSSSITSADAQGNPANAVVPAELVTLTAPLPQVVAVGHKVHYSVERDLWYTDVSFNIGSAYAPFVRLAVARYQPNSLPGQNLEISQVVRIDCIQLPASRTAGIVRVGPLLTLTVTGQSAPNAYGLAHSGSVPGAAHLMTMSVDSRPVGSSDFDWRPVANMTATLTATSLLGATGGTTWTGTFLNTPSTNATTEYRLRIEEVEQFAADASNGGVGSRPVYLDTFPL